ncbi:hypothetical protein Tco_1195626 [Tanacetum coccineum]
MNLLGEVERSRVINYGELVVMEEGNKVEGPMTRDLRRLRSSLSKGDDKELVVTGEVGGGEDGDLLEEDMRILKKSVRSRMEEVIEMDKNDVHILKNFGKGIVLEDRF